MRNQEKITRVKGVQVEILPTKRDAGEAAAVYATGILKEALARVGRARIIIGTGASQLEMVERLVADPGLDWNRIEVFHMDEYVGMPINHPASFRGWLKANLSDRVKPGAVHFLNGDAPDLEAECRRYGALLEEAPIDICFIGFGENGHIAFNDPHVADFEDPKTVKRVSMDERCRRQQVGEGAFPNLESVPLEALTLTCPALLGARHLVCTVPERRKAEAVKAALEGPLSTDCPASAVFTHPNARVYLDGDSASLLRLRAV